MSDAGFPDVGDYSEHCYWSGTGWTHKSPQLSFNIFNVQLRACLGHSVSDCCYPTLSLRLGCVLYEYSRPYTVGIFGILLTVLVDLDPLPIPS